ncbi:hypothetical protein Trydic_g4983 [Trypoxylus dichotomus]
MDKGFKPPYNKEPTPFVIYADLECSLAPTQSDQKIHDHIPYSIGYYVKCSYDDSLSFYRSCRGEDCREWFAEEMRQFAEDVETVFLCPLPIEPLTPAQELEFGSISHCHICERPFDVRDNRVRDHCHVFEQFRISCLKSYDLDPAHYYPLLGYTWDSMLKFTIINLELLTDIDMVVFIERGIRGGLSQCSKRYTAANNKYSVNYRSDQPAKYLIYNDINNQYGWAMSEYLPYGDLNNFSFNVAADNPEGYILEVDLDYSHVIHDSRSDLPFCPEHRAPPNSKEKKLLATLFDKNRYVMHYRSLQQAIENG